MFALHPQLAADCFALGRLGLCRLLLMNDARYPWCVLVPEREDIVEIHQLSGADQHRLIEESSRLAAAMEVAFRPDKLNIAALGNVVPQLHLHHIARFRGDDAWPAPVWGRGTARAYADSHAQQVIDGLRSALAPALTRA